MENLGKFFFEVGHLKRVKRSGWTIAGIKDGESVAEHMYRAALIGYFLARKKKLDAERVMLMLLLHDVPEARIGDMHKLGAKYVDVGKDEWKVVKDQAKMLGKFGDEYKQLIDEFNARKTKEAKLAKQVDYLECALQAKEYLDAGYSHAKEWVEKTGKKITDKECRRIYNYSKKKKASYWWQGLKKV